MQRAVSECTQSGLRTVAGLRGKDFGWISAPLSLRVGWGIVHYKLDEPCRNEKVGSELRSFLVFSSKGQTCFHHAENVVCKCMVPITGTLCKSDRLGSLLPLGCLSNKLATVIRNGHT